MTDISSPPRSDPALVRRLRDGDLDALRDIHTEYAPALRAYCVSRLGDREEADEVVHDTMLTAWSRAGLLPDPNTLRAWLFAVVRNECRRRLDAHPAGDPGESVPRRPASGDHGHEDRTRAFVRSALGHLPPDERDALELAHGQHLSTAEIADVFRVSERRARRLLDRARQNLTYYVSATAIAADGTGECAELASLVDTEDEFTALTSRIGRHLRQCSVCSVGEARRVRPAELIAVVPLLVPAGPVPSLDAVRLVAETRPAGRTSPEAERAGPYDRSGFPRSPERRRRQRIAFVVIAVAALLASAAVAASALAVQGRTPPPSATIELRTPGRSTPVAVPVPGPVLPSPISSPPSPSNSTPAPQNSQPAPPTAQPVNDPPLAPNPAPPPPDPRSAGQGPNAGPHPPPDPKPPVPGQNPLPDPKLPGQDPNPQVIHNPPAPDPGPQLNSSRSDSRNFEPDHNPPAQEQDSQQKKSAPDPVPQPDPKHPQPNVQSPQPQPGPSPQQTTPQPATPQSCSWDQYWDPVSHSCKLAPG
ncbi:RNA polymerase sigma factor [Nocardia aurantia]|uniref:RNA polymerase sigma factor n=1 Tax=Nocardia aurantia TaxID=2585199 RepID=A0A7K0DZX3_9NOCA|nr:RNA polymerase sigma factor [Nocardia aurantia]MQY30822.1 hypothetical protein [Nocardia aurantia]